MESSQGAPANFWTHLNCAYSVSRSNRAGQPGGFPQDRIDLIHRLVLDACDRMDGVQDGLVENPRACRIDLDALACRTSKPDGPCLTDSEISNRQAGVWHRDPLFQSTEPDGTSGLSGQRS